MDPGSAAPTSQKLEKRRAPRFRLRGPTSFSVGDLDGEGTVRDISSLGAFIEATSACLLVGAPCSLSLLINAGSPHLRVSATVVRKTEEGFAVQLTDGQERLKHALDLAVVAAGLAPWDEEDETQPLVER